MPAICDLIVIYGVEDRSNNKEGVPINQTMIEIISSVQPDSLPTNLHLVSYIVPLSE